MLTAYSTPQDIARFYERNSDRVEACAEMHYRAMRRYCIRNRCPSMAQSGVHMIDGTKVAFLCRYERKTDIFVFSKYAYITETNEWLMKAPDVSTANAFTAHSIRRYAERALGRNDMPPEKVLMQMLKRNDKYIIVYADERNNFVRACRDGIFLGVLNEPLHKEVFKTFVSMEMLRRTQRAAYDEVSGLFLQDGFGIDDMVRTRELSRSDTYNGRVYAPRCNHAYEIYSQFFNHHKR